MSHEKQKHSKIEYIKFYGLISIIFIFLLFLLKLNIDQMLSSNAEVKKMIELSYKKHLIDLAVEDNLIKNHEEYKKQINVFFEDKRISNQEISKIDKIYDEEILSIEASKLELLLLKDLQK